MADIKEKIILQDEASKVLKNVANEAKKTSTTFDKLQSKMKFNDPKLSEGFKSLGSKFDGMKDKFASTFPKFASSFGGVGDMVGSIAKINPAITAAVASIGVFTGALKGYFALTNEYIGAFQESMQAETLLAVASLNRRGRGNVSDVVGEANRIESRGIIGGDELVMGATKLMGAGNTKEAKTFQSIMADMMASNKGFAATGADAEKAGEAINKALNGQIKGLQEYGVYVDADTKKRFTAMSKVERSAFIMDELGKAVGGTNEILGKTPLGVKKSFENAFGNIKETVGSWAANGIGAIYGVFTKYLPFFTRVGDAFGKGLAIVGNVLAGVADALLGFGEAIWNIGAAIITPIQSWFSEIGKMIGLGDNLTQQFSYVFRVIGINISYFGKLIGGVADMVSDGLNSLVDSLLIAYYEIIDKVGKILPKSIASQFDIFANAAGNQADIYARMQDRNNKSYIDNISTGFDNYVAEILKAQEEAGKQAENNPLADLLKGIGKDTKDINATTKKMGDVDEEYLNNVRDYFINRNTWNTTNSQIDNRQYSIQMSGKNIGNNISSDLDNYLSE